MAFAFAACAAHPELHPDAPELKALHFSGNHAFSEDDLKTGLISHPTSWVPFTHKQRFDEATFQGDLDRVRTFYRARGYFDAHVVKTEVTPDGKDGVKVNVLVEEGDPCLTRSLTLAGDEALPPELRAQLHGVHTLVVGKIFTQAEYQGTKGALFTALHEAAYAEATIEGQAVVDRLAHAVDVTFQLTPGARYTYSAFDITGNVRVPTARIQQEIDVVMKKGDAFQDSDLDTAQKRIFDLGVFSNAEVTPGPPDRTNGTIPVQTTVIEAPFHTFRAGVGIGLDVEHQEVHVSGGYTDRDFLGGLRRLDFDNVFALEWLPSVFNQVESVQPAFTSTLKLTQPEVIGHDVDLVTSLQVERAAELGFGYWALRGKVGLPWKISRSVTFSPSYNAELLFFDGSSALSGVDLSPAALLSLSCQTCVLSYLEQKITWDRRNDQVEPTFGIFAQLTVQEAGGPFGGDFSNTRWLPEVRGYLPLGKRDVLAVRLQLGALFTYGGTTSPIDQRFFLGGIDSVRGYGAERLSPMVRVNACNPVHGVSLCTPPSGGLGVLDVQVGGNGMIEGSLEVRHKLSEALRLVAFIDAGEVTVQPFAFDFNPSTLAITPGLGIRFITPIGALRADFAYRVSDADRPITQFVGFPQQGGNYQNPANFRPAPSAVDSCPWPFVAQTGWSGYTSPSACKSDFLNRFAFNIAIGEAF